MIPHWCIPLAALALLAMSGYANSQEDFRLGEVSIERGERKDFSLKVPAGETDPATFIPLSVIAGERGGSTILMTAGIHGYEFAPILAADRLAREILPSEIAGTFIIVRVAHVPAYEDRVPYVNPFDRKNLNRSFPGSASGTQTERIAHVLASLVIPSAEFVFDVHSGDGAEWLEAFVGVYGGPLASEYKTALGAAQAMGFPNIVRYSMNTQEQIDRGRSLNRQAVAQGLPTVLVEVGQNGSRNVEDVELIVSGVKNALAFMGMLPDHQSIDPQEPRYLDGTQSVPVGNSGLWYPSRRAGSVSKGEILGEIRSYTGEVVEVVRAPISGFGIYGLAGPPVRRGDSVMTIANPVEKLDETE